jgi:hypothetical protein
MSAVKDSLHSTIEQLDEEEARQLLRFIQHLRKEKGNAPALQRLAGDPAFIVPPQNRKGFGLVEPIQGKGIPASRLLVEDRR